MNKGDLVEKIEDAAHKVLAEAGLVAEWAKGRREDNSTPFNHPFEVAANYLTNRNNFKTSTNKRISEVLGEYIVGRGGLNSPNKEQNDLRAAMKQELSVIVEEASAHYG